MPDLLFHVVVQESQFDCERVVGLLGKVNSTRFRGHPAGTLLIDEIDCDPTVRDDVLIDFGVRERHDGFHSFGRVDFNAVPELVAAELVKPKREKFNAVEFPAGSLRMGKPEAVKQPDGTWQVTYPVEVLVDKIEKNTKKTADLLQNGFGNPNDAGRGIAVDGDGKTCAPYPVEAFYHCPECHGSGEYRGLLAVEACRACGGTGVSR